MVDQSYLDFILDQLSNLSDITSKKMFGGVGLFKEGTMFGMIGGGKFRLRVDDGNKADYEARNMEALTGKGKKQGRSMPYFEVPVDILEDKDTLTIWANKAYEAALRNKK